MVSHFTSHFTDFLTTRSSVKNKTSHAIIQLIRGPAFHRYHLSLCVSSLCKHNERNAFIFIQALTTPLFCSWTLAVLNGGEQGSLFLTHNKYTWRPAIAWNSVQRYSALDSKIQYCILTSILSHDNAVYHHYSEVHKKINNLEHLQQKQ